MIKLKTLKDFKPYMRGTMLAEFDCLKENLKQEAIKYIKIFKTECNSEVDSSRPYAYCRGAIDRFMNFFNITDEEIDALSHKALKGGNPKGFKRR